MAYLFMGIFVVIATVLDQLSKLWVVGNIIDRIRLGYVVDMIEVEFINFPVFNLADCCITCGCIALVVHLVFFNREFWKEKV